MKPRFVIALALILIGTFVHSQDIQTDFSFLGTPVQKQRTFISGSLSPDAIKVLSVLDEPLRPTDVTSWPKQDDEIGDVQIYPVTHSRVLSIGTHGTTNAYRQWELALQSQLAASEILAVISGGPRLAVYVVVTDVRLPVKNRDTSTARVKATYRIVNLDSNTDILKLNIEAVGLSEPSCCTNRLESNTSALNFAVRKNIANFFEKLKLESQQAKIR